MSNNEATKTTNQSGNILEVSHLKKYFPIKGGFFGGATGSVKAVDDVSFNIKRGTTMGLVGESGCGKTTFLRCIGGFETFDGTVKVNGKEVTEPGTDRIMVFQDINQLLPWKTFVSS